MTTVALALVKVTTEKGRTYQDAISTELPKGKRKRHLGAKFYATVLSMAVDDIVPALTPKGDKPKVITITLNPGKGDFE